MNRVLPISLVVFTATIALGQANSRARDLIDLARSNVVLEVPSPAPESLASDGEFAAIISYATGNECEDRSGDEALALECGPSTLRIDRASGWVEMRDARGYDVSDHSLEAEPVAVADLIESAFGIEIGTAQREQSTLKADSLEEGSERINSVTRATKVFVHRRVSGVPVRAQRLVMSFANDRSLRKIIGRWSSIDLGRSQFRSELNIDAVVERAELALTSELQDLDNIDAVHLESEFAVVRDERGSYLDLRGIAVIEGHGPGGTRKITRLDFDI